MITHETRLACRLLLASSIGLLAALFGCGGGGSSSSDCTPGESSACACENGAKGAQICGASGKSYGACDCGGTVTSSFEGDGGGSPHDEDSSVLPVGSGAACTQASDCPTLTCGCHDGTDTAYNACNDGFCATSCPSNDGQAGASCEVPSGCFCASQGCAFGTQTCCASTPTTPSGSACASDCDCVSGDCLQGACF